MTASTQVSSVELVERCADWDRDWGNCGQCRNCKLHALIEHQATELSRMREALEAVMDESEQSHLRIMARQALGSAAS